MSSRIDPSFHADVAVNGAATEYERAALARKLQYASPCGLEAADVVLAWMQSEGYQRSDSSGSEVAQLRRALQNVLGKLFDAQQALLLREPKYVPIRTRCGHTEIWLERKRAWVPVLHGDGWVGTKQIHDAIRAWELEGR